MSFYWVDPCSTVPTDILHLLMLLLKKFVIFTEHALIQKVMFWQLNKGNGKFYGPSIDVRISDAVKKNIQCGTLQVRLPIYFFPCICLGRLLN